MNPTRRAALIAPLFVSLLAFAQALVGNASAATPGAASDRTETRSVAEFQAVGISGSLDLVVRQGPQNVQVQANDKLLPLIETVVENGNHGATLLVRFKRGTMVFGASKALVTVTVPKLTALAGSGSGDIHVEAFATPALKLALSGSGGARLAALQTDELVISISGSSDVQGSGQAARLKINIAGSGGVRMPEMRSDDVTVKIAGSGDASVNAQKTLAVSIAGSGDVLYTGNAAVKTSVAGSGSVRMK